MSLPLTLIVLGVQQRLSRQIYAHLFSFYIFKFYLTKVGFVAKDKLRKYNDCMKLFAVNKFLEGGAMKTCIKWSIAVALIVILLLPLSVIAQTAGAPPAGSPPREAQSAIVKIPNYFAVKAGAYFPEDKWDVLDLGVFEYSLDTGFNGELVFGHYFHRNWAIELGVGYFQTSGDDTSLDVKSKSSIDVMPVTAELKALYLWTNLKFTE